MDDSQRQNWMAWKGALEPSIYVAFTSTVQANPDPTSGTYTFSPQIKLPDAGTSASPTIASSRGVLYLFWRGESDPRINWSTSSDGKTWVNQGPLKVNLSLGPNDEIANTSSAPVAVAFGDCIYVFFRGVSGNDISYAVEEPNWSQFRLTTVSGEVPLTDDSPAVAVTASTIHLAFKGMSNELLWSTNTVDDVGDLQSWTDQTKIFDTAASAPALVVDGNGVVWLAWENPSYFDSNLSWNPSKTLFSSTQLCFASLEAGSKWSIAATRLGIVPGSRPSLISTGPDSTYIMAVWKNPSDDSGISYGPLRLPPLSYVFEVQGFLCQITRSGSAFSWFAPNNDSDYVSLSVQVSGIPGAVTGTFFAGDVQNGGGGGGVTLPPIPVPDNAQVVMTYYILNSSGDVSQAEAVAGAVAQKIVSAALVAAVTASGTLLGIEIGAEIGTAVVPLLGSAIGALAGFVVSETWGLAFPDCDGPVALGVRAFTAAELSTTSGVIVTDEQPSPGMQPPMVTQDGCGSNPQYQVFWTIRPA